MTPANTSTRALALSCCLLASFPAWAQDEVQASEEEDAVCVQAPEPVVSLSYGSRYTEESEDRSDLDEKSNAEVEEALGPVDDFIVDLARAANRAQAGEDDAAEAADCLVDAVHAWAEADALSRLESMNAQISVPSRLGGIAMAYLQAKPHATTLDPARQEVIETWLQDRALATMAFFDTEAPTNASRNNLRAWAGLAAAAVGRSTGNDEILDWAGGTVELVACQADEDGALPLEMARGPRALHYQIHAVGPLVVSAALLAEDGRDLFSACDGALHRIVDFVPNAFEDPALVNDKAGEEQTFFQGDEELRGFELAWAEAYLSRFEDASLAAFVEGYRPLANSKFGGAQGLLW